MLVRRWARNRAAALAAAASASPASSSASASAFLSKARAAGARAPVAGTRILTPVERRLDEAIWEGFRLRSLAKLFPALESAGGGGPGASAGAGGGGGAGVGAGADVNYQRLHADRTSALMAAAFVGDDRAAALLLRRGALAHLRDREGRTAADYALIGAAETAAPAGTPGPAAAAGASAPAASAALPPAALARHAMLRDLAQGETDELAALARAREREDERQLDALAASMSRVGVRPSAAPPAVPATNDDDDDDAGDGFEYDFYVVQEEGDGAPGASTSFSATAAPSRPPAVAARRVHIDAVSFDVALAALEARASEWDLVDGDLEAAPGAEDSDRDSDDEDGRELDYGDEESGESDAERRREEGREFEGSDDEKGGKDKGGSSADDEDADGSNDDDNDESDGE
jgi:hypothetical protein